VEEKIVQKPVMKKRKRIADPTFRVGLSSDNEEGVVERSRKRSKKPVRSKDKALPISRCMEIQRTLKHQLVERMSSAPICKKLRRQV
jgi:hypothetical protein